MNTTITRRVRTGAGPALAVLVTLLALFASAPARALEPVGPSDLVQPTARLSRRVRRGLATSCSRRRRLSHPSPA